MDTIRRLEWKSVFDTVHGYLFRYHKAGDDRVRPSVGSDNADLHTENSRGVVNTVYGNTIKWNQLLNVLNGGTYRGPATYSGVIVGDAITIVPIVGHKYYLSVLINRQVISTNTINIRFGGALSSTSGNLGISVTSNTPNNSVVSAVRECNAVLGGRQIYYHNGTSGGGLAEGDYITITNPMMIDLTELGIDTLTTVAEVESWLALNVGTQDYYPYDAGSLISFGGTAIKSVGFNQWNGATAKVLSGQEYYIGGTYTSLSYSDGTSIVPTNRLFTANKTDNVTITGGSTDTVLNLSCDKNGTYAPYWGNVLPIDPTKVYGKADGEGEYVQVFPDGMRSAGDVHDTLTASEAVVKVLEFTFNTPKIVQSTYAIYTKSSQMRSSIGNYFILQVPLKRIESGVSSSTMSWSENETNINVNYNGVGSDVQSYMLGKKMYFYAKDPITYTDLIYSEDGGVTGTPLSEFTYKVDKYSTEELVVPTSQTGAPTSTALNADIDYQYRG